MVKPPELCRQVGRHVAQAAPPGQLPQRHRHELRLAGHAAQSVPLVEASGQHLEFVSRYQLEQLGEDCVMVRHELGSPLFVPVLRNRMIPKEG